MNPYVKLNEVKCQLGRGERLIYWRKKAPVEQRDEEICITLLETVLMKVISRRYGKENTYEPTVGYCLSL